MSGIFNVVLGGAGIAADFVGIPGLGAGVGLLQEINRTCERMGMHREKCRQLSSKATTLLNTIEDQARNSEHDEMRTAMSELEPVLRTIMTKVHKYSMYGRADRFFKSNEVERGLEECMGMMDAAITDFQVKATFVLQNTQQETIHHIQRGHSEIKEMLAQILVTPEQHVHSRLQYLHQNYSPEAVSDFYGLAQEHLHSLRHVGNNGAGPSSNAMVVDRDMSTTPTRMSSSDSHSPGLTTPTYGTWNRAPSPNGWRMSMPSPTTATLQRVSPQPSTDTQSEQYVITQRIMRELVQMGVAPKVRLLDGEVVKVGEVAQAGGTYSDVWLGDWLNGQKVALKALRNIKPEERAIRRFKRQVDVWSRLKHDNILPFFGICVNLLQNICMVSAWQENGDVRKFVERNPDAQKIRLMRGAAAGMAYLHEQQVVHGNLKCSNILVSETHEARICDFGMSKIIEEVTDNAASQTLTASGSARWLAPELITGQESSPTYASDVYSWAMSVLECLTAKNPYSYCRRDANVVYEVVTNAKIPRRPVDEGPGVDNWLTDELWELMENCWSHDLTRRPTMVQVAERMRAIENTHQWKAYT